MKRAITILSLKIFLMSFTQAQQLVYPDNYLIPNNYDFWEFGDPWTMRVKTNGNIIVYTWLETGLDTFNYALCYKVTDRWGNIIHDVDTIKAPTQSQIYKSPQLDIFQDGKFIITWIDESNSVLGRDAYYQLFDQFGNKINTEVRVNTDSTNSDQFGLPIALSNGNYCIILSDNILNPPGNQTDIWVQCYDNLNNIRGNYNYIGRMIYGGNWQKLIAINDSTILLVFPAVPNFHIKSIRINDKGQKLDSTWFEWTAFQMDSIYTYFWEVEYYNGSIYGSTRKPTYVNLYTTNTVIAKFSYDSSFVTDTVAPIPSKIVQTTQWKVVNDDTLQTNVMSLMPGLGVMNDLDKIVVSWADNRNNVFCTNCTELYTQYLDSSLNKVGLNFVSAPTTSGQTTVGSLPVELSAVNDFFVQLWLAAPSGKMWTNIWSLSTSVGEIIEYQKLFIYPNPTSDKLYFKSDLNFSKFKVYDVLGKLISSGNISGTVIDVSQLQNGIYLLNLIDVKKQTTSNIKFIKIPGSQ
jgi:hypothetical protein